MKRSEKEQVVVKLHERFRDATVSILTDYSGMQVDEIQKVQNAIRKANGTFNVVKNRLAVKAAAGTPLEKVSAHFKGPVALVLGFQDAILPVKTFQGFLKDQPKLKVKVGVFEGQVLDLAELQAVAKLPGRQDLIGTLAVRLKSPLYGFAGTLGGVLSKFARVLNAVKESRASS